MNLSSTLVGVVLTEQVTCIKQRQEIISPLQEDTREEVRQQHASKRKDDAGNSPKDCLRNKITCMKDQGGAMLAASLTISDSG
eukprot:550269-Hanusia_phi.AAC.1